MNRRLDLYLADERLAQSRSAAANLVRLGRVRVNNKVVTKPGYTVRETDAVTMDQKDKYVSRAGYKLASIAQKLNLDFKDKTVLDVGSSTGGFTDFALQHGAKKVYAVDVGSNQLHQSLRGNPAIELHEQTDIRNFTRPPQAINIVLADVSFISLRQVLPAIGRLVSSNTRIAAMCKPQFEAGEQLKNRGVVKNDTMRRKILKEFETWLRQHGFVVLDKADSEVSGQKGNRERFYLLSVSR